MIQGLPKRGPETRPAAYVLLMDATPYMLSVLIEIALLERHDAGLVPNFMAQIQDEHRRNDEVVGNEVEPGEHRGLENADVGAEQDDEEQHQCEPWAVRVELGLEL